MMNSCMTKLEFPPKSYILFRLGKLPHICWLLLHWVLSSFVDPYERFVMLLKSRSHTHHPHMHYFYTGGRRRKRLPSRSTKKCFTPTLGVNTKTCLIGFSIHQINALSSWCYFSKVLLRKRSMGYAKVIHKKRERKNGDDKKWIQKCPRYLKQ